MTLSVVFKNVMLVHEVAAWGAAPVYLYAMEKVIAFNMLFIMHFESSEYNTECLQPLNYLALTMIPITQNPSKSKSKQSLLFVQHT